MHIIGFKASLIVSFYNFALGISLNIFQNIQRNYVAKSDLSFKKNIPNTLKQM